MFSIPMLPRRAFLRGLVPFLVMLAMIALERAIFRPFPVAALFSTMMTVAVFVQNLYWRQTLIEWTVTFATIYVLTAVAMPPIRPCGGRHRPCDVPPGEPPYEPEMLTFAAMGFVLLCLMVWAAQLISRRRGRGRLDLFGKIAGPIDPPKRAGRDPFDDPV